MRGCCRTFFDKAQIESVAIRLSNPGTGIGLDDRIADIVLRTCNLTGAILREFQGATALQSV
jgi:hypothetical protein